MFERDLIFKGTRVDTGDVVEGFFTKKKIGALIVPVIEVYKEWDTGDYMETHEVEPGSVCQYIGIRDKNEKKIFENDLVHVVKDKFGKGEHEYWRVEYGSFGDAQFYVVNGINSCREIECEQFVTFTINGKEDIELEVQEYKAA